MISIIAAVADNGVIGKDNQLIWHISEDLKFFKHRTSGHAVIMGRKTFESIGKALPNRRNIVISRSPQQATIPGVEWAESFEKALEMTSQEEAFVIGGGEIYRLALPYADRLILTEVHHNFEGDTLFPPWDKSCWQEIFREDHPCGQNFEHAFSFIEYQRQR